MRKTSKEVLTESVERRIKHVMVQLLDQFDSRFPDLIDQQHGRLFKFDIKNQFNDAMRATRDELRDYDIEYRPVRMNADNTLSVTKTFMEGIEAITFNELSPGMRIIAKNDPQNFRILEAIRRELNGGVIYRDGVGSYIFAIHGLDICINNVIPFMDLYKLCTSVQAEYAYWRKKVVNMYTHDPDIK